MRSRTEIANRLTQLKPGTPEYKFLYKALSLSDRDLQALVAVNYNTAVSRACIHQPIRNFLAVLTEALWVYQKDVDINKLAWFQFGAPRLKVIAKELEFLALGYTRNSVLERMAAGKKCQNECPICFLDGYDVD